MTSPFDTIEEVEALVETTSDIITVADEAGTILYQNASARDVTGYEEGSIVGESAFDYVHPDDRSTVVELFTEMVEAPGESTKRAEFRFKHADDGWVWLESIGTNKTPAPLDGYVVTSRDITDRKRRETELEQYETAMETVPDGVFMIDDSGTIIRANSAWADMVGYDRAEIRDEPFSTFVEDWLVDKSTVDQYYDLVDELVSRDAGERRGSFTTRARPDGDEHTYEVHIGLLPTDESGGFRGTAGVVRDITERVRRQERLERENERLSEFADIVSHDLRNPLNVLQMSLEMLDGSDHRDRCLRAAERMEELVDDLLALAQTEDSTLKQERIHVGTVARQAWDTVVTDELRLTVDADDTVDADPGQLQQLFENLFRNAVEHATEAGESATVTVELTADSLVITDDGAGFGDVDPDRLFDPTCSSSGNHGLGLRIVEQIATAHDWTVNATEGADGGARFAVEGIDRS